MHEVKSLTESQHEVLEMRSRGISNKEIAHSLGITVSAVEKRLSAACIALEASDVAHAIAIAITHHLINWETGDD